MMYRSNIVVMVTATFVSAVMVIGSPVGTTTVVEPELNDFDDALFTQFDPPREYSIQPWIPESEYNGEEVPSSRDCKTKFEQMGFPIENIEMFNVTYEDCDEPWVMCRHKDIKVQQNDIALRFAFIPVGMRQYIRHIIIVPTSPTSDSDAAYWANDQLIIVGIPSFTSAVGAVARGLAIHGFRNPDSEKPASMLTPYYETPAWTRAVQVDKTVLNTKGLSSQEENFKSMVVLAMYDAQKPGSGEAIVPEFAKVRDQIVRIQRDVIGGTFDRSDKSKCHGSIRNQHN
ncbi:hypothetical protein P280DRAFT_28484 [Massarina eburnea CBS 473.64]|uniref:Uncharacterized protein n=1 Tax=Massarina eburnea CBS 473.64 TaxID=1395130 RepID=A0A6A6RX53_9PLEO|nr:hypothetical protein P280DRAFT_28484 [Massarina eburnea CBS 473.64]